MTIGSGLGFALAGALVPYTSTVFGADGWRMSWFLISSLAGRLWAIIGVASIVSGFSWGRLSDTIGRKRALFVTYFIQGTCLLVLAVDRNPTVITVTAILYALTLWSIPSVMTAACADYVGGKFAPAALGMVTVFFGVGQALSPWLSGYIIDVTHDFAVPFIVSAASSALGAILTLALPKQS